MVCASAMAFLIRSIPAVVGPLPAFAFATAPLLSAPLSHSHLEQTSQLHHEPHPLPTANSQSWLLDNPVLLRHPRHESMILKSRTLQAMFTTHLSTLILLSIQLDLSS